MRFNVCRQASLECLYIYLSPVIDTPVDHADYQLHHGELLKRKDQLKHANIQPEIVDMLYAASDISQVKPLGLPI